MNNTNIRELTKKYINGTATEQEEKLIQLWYNEGIENIDDSDISEEELEESKNTIYANLECFIDSDCIERKKNTNWKIIVAAASIILIGAFAFLTLDKPDNKKHYTKLLNNDVGPGGSIAILKLANGEQVNLENPMVGILLEKDGIKVEKLAEGRLAIAFSKTNNFDNKMNTITTPAGGQYQVKLPDDTEVWLNSESELKFPSNFDKNVRELELEGEAYFEVAKLKNNNKQVPFKVKSKRQQIEVLGTHFNVSCYENDENSVATLIEGSIKVSTLDLKISKVLNPGQQTIVNSNSLIVEPANQEVAIAWKNGDFIFEKDDLKSIMKKVARWYDVEVEFVNEFDDLQFSGAVSKKKNLSQTLKIIELTNKVKFKIDGRRIQVLKA